MPGLRLVAVIPFRGQESRFPAADRERFRRVLAAADHSVTLSPSYHAGCYAVRNNYLVEHAALLVAWYDGSPAAHTTPFAALWAGVSNSSISIRIPRTPAGRTYAVLILSRPAEETHCTAAVFRLYFLLSPFDFLPSLSGLCCCLLPFCCRSPPRPFLSSPLGLSAVAARTLAVAIRFPDGLSRIAFRFL
ncbi:MAG: hypothetical protein ACLRMJ_01490 [Alistipes finegoldii]